MHNKELQLAWDFVNYTNRNIFLTGKAGTGKTTFLHRISKESPKRMAVVAPTGVAAINARGVTIHSLFQMPFGLQLPDGEEGLIKRDNKRKFNKRKINLIRSLDLLIIDEISMVRADMLDAIDRILRRYKDKNKVFGGVQVLMIGDLQQLSPVVKEHEWQILKKYYETPYFFSSQAFQAAKPVNIELKHIYRQQDEEFIKILNEVRDNRLTPESLKILNSRYIPDFEPPADEKYILLTTHNYKADKINTEKLEAIDERKYFFHAYTEGNFPENAYPVDEKLGLKKGAQVMFIKNDSSYEKRYFNGKIGEITEIDDKHIKVMCPGDDEEIEVGRETWENITYELNTETGKIEEKIKGSFSQIPLRLSWAITIHKSQGLTFDKAIIDAGDSFAHGQTYVALSRCKTLEGMVLKTPVTASSIINDKRVAGFNDYVANHLPDKNELLQSQKRYFLDIISELFDYYPLLYPAKRMIDIHYKNKTAIKGNVAEIFQKIKDNGIVPLLKVKENFIKQLQQMSSAIENPEEDEQIQERLQKALDYFKAQTSEQILKLYEELTYETENQQVLKELEKNEENFRTFLMQKKYLLENLTLPFSVRNYLDVKAKSLLQEVKKKSRKRDYSKLLVHVDLFEALRQLRSDFAMEEDVPHFQIFTQETLFELTEKLPVTPQQLKKIHGIGKVRLQKYGDAIIELIKSYCIANNIEMKEDEAEKPAKKQVKNTKKHSLELFQSGMTPEEIAAERQLTLGTIISHLSSFFETGEVKITDLMDEKKYKEIKKIVEPHPEASLSELKRMAGDDYTWDELRLVRKYLYSQS